MRDVITSSSRARKKKKKKKRNTFLFVEKVEPENREEANGEVGNSDYSTLRRDAREIRFQSFHRVTKKKIC